MKKYVALLVLFLSFIANAQWWASWNDSNNQWVSVPVESWMAATETIPAGSDTDIFWGSDPDSSGPWIDFYWDGTFVWGWSHASDFVTVPWHGQFSSYEEAYASASSVLASNSNFTGAFPEPPLAPVQNGKRLAKGHNK